ncbi:MAG: thiamine-phosphate kinase [Dehalococcoidia bacterium]|nr:thiamine-phosphate kinase [Dehalococcoidia bacterium]
MDIGEFGLIAHIAEIIKKRSSKTSYAWNHLCLGIGDDAAAWSTSRAINLATTDIMIEEVHFDLKYTGWYDLGWKSIASNLSDIAAMGGVPLYALVSLAFPGDVEVENITALYQGMVGVADNFQVVISGGNISFSKQVIISITLLGKAAGNKLLTRAFARQGDYVAITGYPGLSAAGYEVLRKKLDIRPNARKIMLDTHLRPLPRINEARILLKNGVRSAIDTSDGLVADLTHICEASRVSAAIYETNLPLHPFLNEYFPEKSLEFALTGGEDYELLFTAGKAVMDRIKNRLSCPVTIIGEIMSGTPGEVKVFDKHGKSINLENKGWDHYRSRL